MAVRSRRGDLFRVNPEARLAEIAMLPMGPVGLRCRVARWPKPDDVALMIDGDITITTSGVSTFTASSSSSGRSYTVPMD